MIFANSAAAADTINATVTLVNVSGNTWMAFGTAFRNGAVPVMFYNHGTKTLAGVLDRIRVTTFAGDTFDAGSVNIIYQ